MVELDKKHIEQKLFSSEFNFEDSSVFKELMNLYPWCSTFTVVYLKSLSLTNDMRFQKELEEYAVHLNSREIIYDLISGSEIGDLQKHSEEEKFSTVEPVVNNEIENEIGEAPAESTDEPPLQQDDELDKLIVSNVISDNIINEIEDENRSQDPVKKITEEKGSEKKPEIKNITKSVDAPKSFNDWLRQGDKKSKESVSKEYLTFEKPKTDFFKPQATAKESIAKKNLPVSETLAKVFESQGNYPMAISTYEQLILIFPEKKIFFANQIEKINSKII